MIKLTIPGQPCAKGRPRLGKFGTYTPTKTVNYETLVKQLYIIGNHGKQLEGPLGIHIKAFFQVPKSKEKAFIKNAIFPTTKPDWDNVGKIISDSLNGLAYKDDSQIVAATVDKDYTLDNPRVEVEIWEVEA